MPGRLIVALTDTFEAGPAVKLVLHDLRTAGNRVVGGQPIVEFGGAQSALGGSGKLAQAQSADRGGWRKVGQNPLVGR